MSKWTPKQRFLATAFGEPADNPPVSAWRHFIESEQTAEGMANAMIKFQKQYNWDFVKINPRATYYAEAWGNCYDFTNYEGVVPVVTNFAVHNTGDLDAVAELSGKAGPFGEQLEAIRLIRKELGEDTAILQTVFSPLAVLEYLAGHRTLAGSRPVNRMDTPLPELFSASPSGVHQALQNITRTLASYVSEALQAGADGFFYAELGLAQDGYLTVDEFEEFCRSYDLMLLEELSKVPTILHTCGPNSHPERFADYPVRVLHWADHAAGNPSLKGSEAWAGDKTLMGGVDENLFSGTNQREVLDQAKRAINEMYNRPFLLAPGCGLPLNTTTSTLLALHRAVIEA
ncbi:MAG: uroporphyrinogen decarboxylase family protein [Syntrophomonadaceae bacterium]|nr:uroporphyrinogen decarboxylase family protein [Syntrophomonadaceae bacterium]